METLTQRELKKYIRYDKYTGYFYTINGDKIFGSINNKGYIIIPVKDKSYLAHRLAWLYECGYFPKNKVAHKNDIKFDNRFSNLFEVSQSCNFQDKKISKRNKTGFNGVSFIKAANKYTANITLNNKQYNLGCYENVIDAALARLTAEECIPEWSCNYLQESRMKLYDMGYISDRLIVDIKCNARGDLILSKAGQKELQKYMKKNFFLLHDLGYFYNYESGVRVRKRVSKREDGYLYFFIKGNNYRVDELIYLFLYGEIPKYGVHHLNGDKEDNRLVNLMRIK